VIDEAEAVIVDVGQIILTLRRLAEAPAASYQAVFAEFQRLRGVFESHYDELVSQVFS
jgi:hypothetical protein